MGAIFYRGGSPTEVEEMTYFQLQYWYTWHDVYYKEETKQADEITNPSPKPKNKK